MTALMFAAQSGNAELVKLLLKRKADSASKNKNSKTAADLAHDDDIKKLLQEAALAAQQQKEDTARPDVNTAQTPSDPLSATGAHDSSSVDASDHVEIGPQERPAASMPQAPGNAAELDDGKHLNGVRKRTNVGDHSMHNQPDNDQQSERPAKIHKVALSFAEEAQDDEQ